MVSADVSDVPEGESSFASMLCDAIAHQSLSLDEIRDRLHAAGTPVSRATLSYWQNGRSLPSREGSLKAVAELEKILNLAVGQLSGALPAGALTWWDGVRQAAVPDQAEALMETMGMSLQGRHSVEYLRDGIQVPADRLWQFETTEQVLRAEVDGLDRVPVVFRMNFLEEPPPLIEPIAGCELGRVVQLDDEGLLAGELLLPRPLQVGELHMLEYRLVWEMQPGESEGGFTRVLPRTMSFLVIDVQIDGEPPVSASYFTAPHAVSGQCGSAAADLRQQLPPQNHLQVTLNRPTPGSHGIAWGF
ncbi:hypothetical protein AAEX63_02670 [Luteococcus sp. H138]|uniref:hypothetical protein n=1 Tax=unclassified Luteococcus TaxID=2639923 RepID=UPI00313EA213